MAMEDAMADELRPIELDPDDQELYEEIKRRQVIIMRNAHVNNTKNKPRVERSKKTAASLGEMKQRLGDVGIDAASAVETLRNVKNKLRMFFGLLINLFLIYGFFIFDFYHIDATNWSFDKIWLS